MRVQTTTGPASNVRATDTRLITTGTADGGAGGGAVGRGCRESGRDAGYALEVIDGGWVLVETPNGQGDEKRRL